MVSPKLVGLRIQMFVNGESRQDSHTNDLPFNVKQIIRFISQGTTLEQGTVIMTGTPSGVAFGMKPKPVWLKDEDIVEVKGRAFWDPLKIGWHSNDWKQAGQAADKTLAKCM